MELSVKIFLFLSFPFLYNCEQLQVNDVSYRHMPELFSFDDYVECMRLTNSLYCMITLELHAERDNLLYKFIQDYSSNVYENLNHSVLDRGVCVPKTCKVYTEDYTEYNEEDLKLILEKCFNETIWNEYQLEAKVQTLHYCSTNETKPKESKLVDWITILILIGILSINFIGSCFDVYFNEKLTHLEFLRSFSVFRNWKDLFKKSIESNEVSFFPALNAIKVLILFMIIFAHSALYIIVYTDSVEYYEGLHKNGYLIIFKYGLNIVQVFFGTSGFLLAYKFCEAEETRKFSWKDIPKLIVARYMGLSPCYAVVLLLTISFTPYFAYGPIWDMFAGAAARDCHTYFWYHMFYVHNYISDDKHCAIQTWHLAADMQLFIVGVLVLILAKRQRLAVFSILWLLSFVGPVLDVLNGLDPVAVPTPQFVRTFDNDTIRFSHLRGHNHLTCFIAAMIIGQLNYKWRKQSIKFENKLLAQSLLFATIAGTAVIFSIKQFYTGAFKPSLAEKLIYLLVYRITICIIAGFAFTTMAMELDSTMYRVLNWPGWKVPSKLCYCIYLTHVGIIYLLIGTRTTKATTSVLHLLITYFGVVVMSIILSTILHILVEAPCNKLLKPSPKIREHNKQFETKVE